MFECARACPTGLLDADPTIEAARHEPAEQFRNWRHTRADDGGLEEAHPSDVANVHGADTIDDSLEDVDWRFVQHEVVGCVEQDLDARAARPSRDVEKSRRALREIIQ